MGSTEKHRMLLKRLLPFVLTLTAGASLFDLIRYELRRTKKTDVATPTQTRKTEQELNDDLKIISIPAMDFTDEARRSWGFTATIKLDAEFGANGKTSNIKPSTIFDPQFASGFPRIKGLEYPELMSFNHHPVRSLPFNLLETAVEATKGIQFKPKIKNGVPVSTKARIVFDFVLSSSVETPGSFIKTSINEIWHNEQYVPDTYDRYDPTTGRVFINE